jgi:hypothetical protein
VAALAGISGRGFDSRRLHQRASLSGPPDPLFLRRPARRRESKPKGVPLGGLSESANEEGALAAKALAEESLGRVSWRRLGRSERTLTRARPLAPAETSPPPPPKGCLERAERPALSAKGFILAGVEAQEGTHTAACEDAMKKQCPLPRLLGRGLGRER